MKRIAFLLCSALSLGGGLLVSAGPVQAQASACGAEILSVQQQLRSTPITANRSYIKPSTTTRISGADGAARPLATSSPTRLGTSVGTSVGEGLGESLGQGRSAGPGGFRRSAHVVPNGSGEARSTRGALPDAPGLWSYNVPALARTERTDADSIQSGAASRGGGPNPNEVVSALARARTFDQAGDHRACMNAVREAQRYLR